MPAAVGYCNKLHSIPRHRQRSPSPIPISISADPSPLPCCHSHFTTTPAVTSHIGSCQAPERIRCRTTGATNAILGLISSPPTRERQFSTHLLRDFFLEIYELLRLSAPIDLIFTRQLHHHVLHHVPDRYGLIFYCRARALAPRSW